MIKVRLTIEIIIFGMIVFVPEIMQAQTLRVRVENEENFPVSEALIKVYQDNKIVCDAVSDQEGNCECSSLSFGEIMVECSSSNYSPKTVISWYSIQSRDVLIIRLSKNQVYELDSLTITASHQMADYDGQINMTRSQYKTMAGSFQDPSRVMLHFPGFSTDNDGTNAFFFRGLPGYSTHWQISDAEVVNPNHLITAGNRGDAASLNSGGVNALTSSVIGTYSFQSNPASISQSNMIGGISNLQFASKLKNYAEVSLIGFEAGLCMTKSNKSTYATARNSFVGLLEKLGVPFGDESINYQDFSFVTELIKTKKLFLSSYAVYGQSRNFHAALSAEDTKLYSKDFKDILYTGQLGIIGLKSSWIVNKFNVLHWTINYSGRRDRHNEHKGSVYPNFSLIDSINRIDQIQLLSSHIQYKSNLKNAVFSSGIRVNHNVQSRNQIQSDYKSSFVRIYPYLDYAYYLQNWTFNAGVGIHNIFIGNGKNHNILNYSANIEKTFNRGFEVKVTHRFSDQIVDLLSDQTGLLHVKINAAELSVSQKTSSFSWRLGGFYLFIRDNLSGETDKNELLSTFNGLDFGLEFESIHSLRKDNARTYGVESWASKTYSIGNSAIDLIGNIAYTKSQYKLNDGKWLPARTDVGFSGSFASYWTIQKKVSEWNIGGIFHAREGLRDYFTYKEEEFFWQTDYGLERKQSLYSRLDVRVVFTKKGKKKRQHRISLDIQNLLNRKNEGFVFYDKVFMDAVSQYQLGLVPVLGYRFEY